ncbi:MAG: hypothetical protein JJU02_00790 [Cryomorphaceae bacterium]|nr:hypothetical protein [Cryomorphaceae bacterium]
MYSNNRKNAPLTREEWLYFLGPLSFLGKKNYGVDSDFTQSELQRFKQHGFHRKAKQATLALGLSFLFWGALVFGLILWVFTSISEY